jgi:hypothetical protein
VDITGNSPVCVNSTRQLTGTPSNGTWQSSNTAAATVSVGGLVTGVAAGTSTIRYTYTDGNGCTNYKEVTVTVVPTPVYPDIRLRVCPDAGNVNLMKYIDATDNVNAIQWAGQIPGSISAAGVVSTNILASAHVLTFTYTITSQCVANQQRKIYLEVIKNGNVRRLRDTIVICNVNADAVQINQIFGIESGDGDDWSYHAVNSGGGTESIGAHVAESAGAVVMNGKAIYHDNSIPYYNNYHGLNNVKIVKITYESDDNTCLEGKEFAKVIVLTGS